MFVLVIGWEWYGMLVCGMLVWYDTEVNHRAAADVGRSSLGHRSFAAPLDPAMLTRASPSAAEGHHCRLFRAVRPVAGCGLVAF